MFIAFGAFESAIATQRILLQHRSDWILYLGCESSLANIVQPML
jgi:hypothetical protein